jgi:hypothetical protein
MGQYDALPPGNCCTLNACPCLAEERRHLGLERPLNRFRDRMEAPGWRAADEPRGCWIAGITVIATYRAGINVE